MPVQSHPSSHICFPERRFRTPAAVQIGPFVVSHVQLWHDRTSALNEEAAFRYRVNAVWFEPDPEAVGAYTRFVSELIRTRVKKHCARVPLDFEVFLALCKCYSEGRAEEMRVVWRGRPSDFIRDVAKILRRVHAFLKDEGFDMAKAGRGIYSRPDLAKCYFGRYIKIIEEELYKWPEFVKNVPVTELPQYIENVLGSALYYYVVDYSSYESVFTPTFYAATDGQLYEWCGLPKIIMKILGGKQHIHWSSGRSRIEGRRMSGEVNTSLGNGFANIAICKFVASQCGDPNARVVVEGDDAIIACSVPLDELHFNRLGIKVDLKLVPTPGHAGFCQQYWDVDHQRMLSPSYMMRVGWSSKCPVNASAEFRMQLLAAKLMSLSWVAPHSPLFWNLSRLVNCSKARFHRDYWTVRKLAEMGMQVPTTKGRWIVIPFTPNADIGPPSDSTRSFFEGLYGLTPTQQLAIENDPFCSIHLRNWLDTFAPDTARAAACSVFTVSEWTKRLQHT